MRLGSSVRQLTLLNLEVNRLARRGLMVCPVKHEGYGHLTLLNLEESNLTNQKSGVPSESPESANINSALQFIIEKGSMEVR